MRTMDPKTLEDAGLQYDVAGPVATITLNRPAVRNAQTPTMWHALAAIGDELPDDVRVVVLKGAGAAFSAGLDRSMLDPSTAGEGSVVALMGQSDDEVSAAIDGYQRGFTFLRDPRFVSIAAGARLRDRRRLPAGALVRPAGRRGRRAVLHEGVGARPGAGPDRNKAAGRERWLCQGAGDLCHGADGRRGGVRGHRARARRRTGRGAGRDRGRPRGRPDRTDGRRGA